LGQFVSHPAPASKAVRSAFNFRAQPQTRADWVLVGGLVLLIALVVLSILVGRYPIPLTEWVKLLTHYDPNNAVSLVLLEVRLPRIAAGILIGGGMALAGASYQGLFRNPMVSPDILGASAGAGFGAALGILFGLNIASIQALGFLFGMLAVFIAWTLATWARRSGDPILMLVLIGILVGSVFTALLSLIKFVADPYSKLPAITFWLMGGLASINLHDALFAAVPILAGAIPLLLLRWRLNVLSFGEEEARAMGMHTTQLRFVIIACSTLITAGAVSIAGMIGWVGLVIPHLARLLVGANHRVLLPASLLLGSCYLLLVDDVARCVYATEIPLGILTSLIGAPFFLYLLTTSRRVQG